MFCWMLSPQRAFDQVRTVDHADDLGELLLRSKVLRRGAGPSIASSLRIWSELVGPIP
jgi:hypothetical protein